MATKYWVGNGGNWSDTAHWALSSGGPGGTGMPTLNDQVIFDNNSITATGQTVVVNTTYCKTAGLDFSSINKAFTLQFNDSLYIFNGNAILSSLVICLSDRFGFYFASGECHLITNECIITSLTINYWTYGGATSPVTLTLLDDVTIIYDLLVQDSLITNSYSISAGTDITLRPNELSILQLGSSTISCEWFTDYNIYNATINFDTSVIICTYGFENLGYGSSNTYYDIVFSYNLYDEFYFYGKIYCHSLTISSGFSQIYLDASWPEDDPIGPEIIVSDTISISGSVEHLLEMYSGWSEGYNWILTKSDGIVSIENVVLSNSTAQGGATFYALFSNGCVDGGGNVGWIFELPPTPTLVEPVGRYNEGDHIAYAPGDSGGTAVWKEASSSPVPITPTHRPGCGYWFQVEGTVYGGEVGAWIPWNVDQKVEFNEGSRITKSPRVSGGSPIWKVNQSGPAITDTHIPCGYWFKDYDSNSQLYRICFGLEMGYTKTNMIVNEQQTLYVKDSNGDTVDCQITTWTLDGVGSLSNSVGPTTVYTAPDYSEAGADSATITLWCGGVVKDTLVISIAHSCDCLDTIVYTSLQMSVNQQQTLSASGMQSDECYSWAITSGGGSLSALTGKSVVYTAPASNANCLSNPTITLSCGGVVIDTIKIAVNQVTQHYSALEIKGTCLYGCVKSWDSSFWKCKYEYYYYRTVYCCDGSIYSGPTKTSIVASQVGCDYTDYPACTNLKNNCDNTPGCIAVGGCCNTYVAGITDYRTSTQKLQGCCPAQLL